MQRYCLRQVVYDRAEHNRVEYLASSAMAKKGGKEFFHPHLLLQKMEELALLARRIHVLLFARSSGSGNPSSIQPAILHK